MLGRHGSCTGADGRRAYNHPATFDRLVARGAPAPVSLQIDNVENDFTDDVKRGVDLAVNRFAAHSAPRGALLIAREVDQHRTAVPYDQYVMVSIVVVAIMIGGLFYGGVNVAREYELRSIIDVLLSPRPRSALLLGMTLELSSLPLRGRFWFSPS